MTTFVHATGPIVKADLEDVQTWGQACQNDPDHKYRFCAHLTPEDPLHEMIILHCHDTIVPIHKHHGKTESFTFFDGRADVVLYYDDGTVMETIHMGPYDSGWTFYYRLNGDIYHTLKIITPMVVFHECTNGPWHKSDMLLAPFWEAPKGWHR